MPEIGEKAPDFTLPSAGGTTVSLNDYAGKFLVLYFYPRDDTPGCTKEGIGFSDQIEEFKQCNAEILGVSKDSLVSHEKFSNKHDLKVKLASDEHGSFCEDMGVWVEKNMYGKKFMGIERATFLINEAGIIHYVWRKVKVAGHVDDVLRVLKCR